MQGSHHLNWGVSEFLPLSLWDDKGAVVGGTHTHTHSLPWYYSEELYSVLPLAHMLTVIFDDFVSTVKRYGVGTTSEQLGREPTGRIIEIFDIVKAVEK